MIEFTEKQFLKIINIVIAVLIIFREKENDDDNEKNENEKNKNDFRQMNIDNLTCRNEFRRILIILIKNTKNLLTLTRQ